MCFDETDEVECPFIVGRITQIIDDQRIRIQLYSPFSKKIKYGLSKFGKRYEGKKGNKDVFSEEIIEICTIVTWKVKIWQDSFRNSWLNQCQPNNKLVKMMNYADFVFLIELIQFWFFIISRVMYSGVIGGPFTDNNQYGSRRERYNINKYIRIPQIEVQGNIITGSNLINF